MEALQLDESSDTPAQTRDDSENHSEEMGMAELLAQQESASEQSDHSLLMAKVVSIIQEGALVDIGKKSEALIPRKEWGDSAPFLVGESVPVLVSSGARRGGYVIVSWRAACEQVAWEHIEQAHKRKLPIQAKVKNHTSAGLIVECENILRGFMPASQVDVRYSNDLKRWRGKSLFAYIMEYDAKKNNLVLSRKLWLSEENQKKKRETLATLKVGEIRKGVVTGMGSFGAWVDMGGIEALLPIGELEWSRTDRVSDLLKIGQEIEVKVVHYDPANEKISLSRKELLPHPWEGIEKKFSIGSLVEGKVMSVTDFGIFVEIAPRIEGLLHLSEISWNDSSPNPRKLFKRGDLVKVKVMSIDRQQGRLSLSLKRTQESPWTNIQKKISVGSVIKAIVTSLTSYGAFARLPEGVVGLVHISDFSWTKRIRHPEDLLKIGQELELKVLKVDRKKEEISLGLKQLTVNPYEKYGKGTRVITTVTRIMESGVLTEIEPDLEGFIPHSEISAEKFDKISDLLSVDEQVETKVVSVDSKERKIILSIKQLDLDLQRAARKKYSKNAQLKLGELLNY